MFQNKCLARANQQDRRWKKSATFRISQLIEKNRFFRVLLYYFLLRFAASRLPTHVASTEGAVYAFLVMFALMILDKLEDISNLLKNWISGELDHKIEAMKETVSEISTRRSKILRAIQK
jgi:hypothetical protein